MFTHEPKMYTFCITNLGKGRDLLTTTDLGTVGETLRSNSDEVACFSSVKRFSLDTDDVTDLTEIYSNMHGNVTRVFRISEEFKAIQVNGQVIKSSFNTEVQFSHGVET